MDASTILLIVVAVGALLAFIAPGASRFLGWLVVAGSVVGSIVAYMKITAGTSDFVGGVMIVIGGLVALVILVVGCALGFGMIGGGAALRAVANGEQASDASDADRKG